MTFEFTKSITEPEVVNYSTVKNSWTGRKQTLTSRALSLVYKASLPA